MARELKVRLTPAALLKDDRYQDPYINAFPVIALGKQCDYLWIGNDRDGLHCFALIDDMRSLRRLEKMAKEAIKRRSKR